MALEVDAQEFLDTEDGFASEAIYTRHIYPHPSSKSDKINGVFRQSYIETNDQENATPIFTTDTKLVPHATLGDFLRLGDDEYTVVNVQPIMNGIFTRLYLEAA